MVATGGSGSTRAAKSATSTIPIVYRGAADPVVMGLVASFSRPGGNATGVSIVTIELKAKRLDLLHELVPKADGNRPARQSGRADAESNVKEAQEASLARSAAVTRLASPH